MSYTPSPVSTHGSKEEGIAAAHASVAASPTEASPLGTPGQSRPQSGLDYAQAEPFPTEPTKGFWRYSPFQYMSLKPKINSPYIMTAIACMGGVIFGFGSTNLTPFIGKDDYLDYFGAFSPIHQSGMTACMPGGAFIGAIISTLISEHMGRRGMMQVSGIFWLIGSAIQCAANNRVALLFGRIIAGIGVGTASSNVPMYLAEMVPADQRGRFTSCFQFSNNLGILSMFYIGFGCHFLKGQKGFRLAWGLQMIPGAIMLFGSMFLEESPRWLASKGRWDETVEVLTKLRHATVEDPVVRRELEQFQEDVEIVPARFIDLFKKQNIKQTGCTFLIMLTQQFCGCNAILYFSTSITSQVGYHGTMNDIMGSIDYIVLLAATVPSLIFFDRWSRRHNLLGGGLAMLTCLCIVAGIEGARGRAVGPEGLNGDPSVRWDVPSKPPAKAALAFSYIYLGFFSLSWGPCGWLYVGEIFNQDARSVGNAFGSGVNWLFNFVLSIFTQSSFEHIKWKTYVIFAVFTVVALPFVFFFFPETRGYELEQISEVFKSNVAAYKTDPWYIAFMKMRRKEVQLPQPVPEKKEMQETHEYRETVDIE